MKKVIRNSLILAGLTLALSQNAADARDPGRPPGRPPTSVPDAGTTASILAASVAGLAMVRKVLSNKK